MRNIDELIEEIIPPPDYQHRNGFSNEHIILSLSENEKNEIEHRLIQMLEKGDDTLIGESLAIMKSSESLPFMRKILSSNNKSDLKIIWASYINEIKDGDEEMINLALEEFDNVSEKYSRIGIFHYLSKFNDSRIKNKVNTFINHEDYLTAYNARTSLGIDTKEVIERERVKDKPTWWKFWKK